MVQLLTAVLSKRAANPPEEVQIDRGQIQKALTQIDYSGRIGVLADLMVLLGLVVLSVSREAEVEAAAIKGIIKEDPEDSNNNSKEVAVEANKI